MNSLSDKLRSAATAIESGQVPIDFARTLESSAALIGRELNELPLIEKHIAGRLDVLIMRRLLTNVFTDEGQMDVIRILHYGGKYSGQQTRCVENGLTVANRPAEERYERMSLADKEQRATFLLAEFKKSR